MSEDDAKFAELRSKTYKEQGIWFMNSFWKSGPTFSSNSDLCELMWKYVNKCAELDKKNGDAGCELDEFQAHRLLEQLDDALTVTLMRDVLEKSGITFRKMVSLIEVLVYKFDADWHFLVNAAQVDADEAEKIRLAEEAVEESKQALEAAIAAKKAADEALEAAKYAEASAQCAEKDATHVEMAAATAETEARTAEQAAIKAEMEAKNAEAEAAKAEADAKSAEADAFRAAEEAKAKADEATKAADEMAAIEKQVADALATLQREEDAYNNKIAELTAIGEDMSKGTVKRNTAKAELAQLKASDPMPLQRAKITQEAVLRKQARATKSANAAAVAASQSAATAEKSSADAVKAREDAEFALGRARGRRENAETTRASAQESRAAAEEKRAEAAASLKLAQEARVEATESRERAENAAKDAAEAEKASEAALAAAVEKVKKVTAECTGSGQGKIWWMGRELEERKKYMSQAQLAKLEAASA